MHVRYALVQHLLTVNAVFGFSSGKIDLRQRIVSRDLSPGILRTSRLCSTTDAPEMEMPAKFPPESAELRIMKAEEIVKMEEKDEFDWFKSWYPIVPVESLDKEKPHAFKLLGMDIVIWNDGPVEGGMFGPKKSRTKGAKKMDGRWRVFVDQCPHRKVPLSDGRIEDDGTLMCSYHAWRFGGDGNLQVVPQVEGKKNLDKIRSNPKSNCNAFPAQVVDGLLWVWSDSGPDSALESALSEVPMMKLTHQVDDEVDESSVTTTNWNFREVPYGADFFVENVVDPAHVGVSHHNIVGNRYAEQTIEVKMIKPLTKDGFTIKSKLPGEEHPATTTFNAPGQVFIETEFGPTGEAKQFLELYVSPSRPGFSNHVGRMVILKDKNGATPQLLKAVLFPMPKWLTHIISSFFLNQDGLFLHSQERAMSYNDQYSTAITKDHIAHDYTKAVLPTDADRGVLKYRTWLKRKAGGRIPYKGDITMPPISKDVVFDVWNSHTKHCKICLDALTNFKRARFAAFLSAALAAVLRPKILGDTGLAGFVAAFSGLGFALNKVIQMFYRYEFSHADNH